MWKRIKKRPTVVAPGDPLLQAIQDLDSARIGEDPLEIESARNTLVARIAARPQGGELVRQAMEALTAAPRSPLREGWWAAPGMACGFGVDSEGRARPVVVTSLLTEAVGAWTPRALAQDTQDAGTAAALGMLALVAPQRGLSWDVRDVNQQTVRLKGGSIGLAVAASCWSSARRTRLEGWAFTGAVGAGGAVTEASSIQAKLDCAGRVGVQHAVIPIAELPSWDLKAGLEVHQVGTLVELAELLDRHLASRPRRRTSLALGATLVLGLAGAASLLARPQPLPDPAPAPPVETPSLRPEHLEQPPMAPDPDPPRPREVRTTLLRLCAEDALGRTTNLNRGFAADTPLTIAVRAGDTLQTLAVYARDRDGGMLRLFPTETRSANLLLNPVHGVTVPIGAADAPVELVAFMANDGSPGKSKLNFSSLDALVLRTPTDGLAQAWEALRGAPVRTATVRHSATCTTFQMDGPLGAAVGATELRITPRG